VKLCVHREDLYKISGGSLISWVCDILINIGQILNCHIYSWYISPVDGQFHWTSQDYV